MLCSPQGSDSREDREEVCCEMDVTTTVSVHIDDGVLTACIGNSYKAGYNSTDNS